MRAELTIAETIAIMQRHPSELRRRVAALGIAEREHLAFFARALLGVLEIVPPVPERADERADWLMAN
jgi:hypothetical protein